MVCREGIRREAHVTRVSHPRTNAVNAHCSVNRLPAVSSIQPVVIGF